MYISCHFNKHLYLPSHTLHKTRGGKKEGSAAGLHKSPSRLYLSQYSIAHSTFTGSQEVMSEAARSAEAKSTTGAVTKAELASPRSLVTAHLAA